MVYYKVKKEFDNMPKNKNFDIFIKNELYTEKELQKVKKQYFDFYKNVYNFDRIFEKMEISKNKTYFFFGARFTEV